MKRMLHARWLAILVVASCCVTAAVGAQEAGIDLVTKANQWKASMRYDALSSTGAILRGGDLVRFKLGNDLFVLGSGELLRSAPISQQSGQLYIPAATAAAIESWFARRDAERASRFSIAAILIDPGHGGRDPGAIGEHGTGSSAIRIAEKDITLLVALELKKRLQAMWPDKAILITRSDDSYPSLDERVAMGNSVKLGPNEAIIYVSVHANASFNKAASGYEVWYLNPDYRRTVLDPSQAALIEPGVVPILNSMLEEEFTTESVFLARAIMDGLGTAIGSV
ncbi:MAG TPA: N-acetylmuramoyl-L-alanine amidase, partial [Spirochaetales bacterium]|nr:N-acetylmuramoyl-L-alanine amidase [Spirochaetales bacterium]